MFDLVLILSRTALGLEKENVINIDTFSDFKKRTWLKLLNNASFYGVSGLVIDSVSSVFSDVEDKNIPLDAVMQYSVELIRIEHDCAILDAGADHIIDWFRKEGLHPQLRKGPSVAKFYPNPLHRDSGDIDIFLKPDEFAKAKALVSKFDPLTCSDGSLQLMWNFDDGEILVEIQKNFFDCKEQFGTDGKKSRSTIDMNSPEAQLLLISSHIMKHCLGRGVSLKQINDYAVLRRHYSSDSGVMSRFQTVLKKAGLVKWNNLLDRFVDDPYDTNNDLYKIVAAYNPVMTVNYRSTKMSRMASRMTTAFSFVKTIPFALKYAPKEWFHTIFSLI